MTLCVISFLVRIHGVSCERSVSVCSGPSRSVPVNRDTAKIRQSKSTKQISLESSI